MTTNQGRADVDTDEIDRGVVGHGFGRYRLHVASPSPRARRRGPTSLRLRRPSTSAVDPLGILPATDKSDAVIDNEARKNIDVSQHQMTVRDGSTGRKLAYDGTKSKRCLGAGRNAGGNPRQSENNVRIVLGVFVRR